jgi:preprotein translocase subunit SecD
MIGRVKRLLPLVLLACLCICLGVGCGSSHACSSGSEIVLRAVPQRGETVTPAGMKLAQQIMTNRVSTIGVASPKITLRGNDEIVISGSPVPKSLPRVVSVTGNLQLFDFEEDLAPPTVENGNPTPYPTLFSLLTAVKGEASKGTPEAYYLFGTKTKVARRMVNGERTTKTTKIKDAVLAGPDSSQKQLLAPYRGHQPPGTTILAVPANREVVSGGIATQATQPVKVSPDGKYWYLFKLPPEISGADLNESEIQAGTDPNSGAQQVWLGFTRHGAKEFQEITKAEYERGQLVAGLHGPIAPPANQLYVQHNAIVLDGKLLSSPYIDYTDNSLSLGIAGGAAILSNMGSSDAANKLALVLKSGSLPYRFEVVSSRPCQRQGHLGGSA